MNEMAKRVARTWMTQPNDPRLRKITPTQFQVRQLGLPVSDARFDRAMSMAARDMGGHYIAATGTIKLPRVNNNTDKTFPTELQVLYRKFPCGFLMPKSQADSPVAGLPCVSFEVLPNTPGDPRHSRIYQTFTGEAATSKTLFGKFLGWLKIISKAVKRYIRNSESGHAVPFARVADQERMASAVVEKWVRANLRGQEERDAPC